jgi:Cu(I)/Ag(I) efflux system membrane fusion protein
MKPEKYKYMKELFKNRKILFTILITLILGVFIGWLIKPSSDHDENESSLHQHDASSEEVWTCSMHPQIRQPEPGNCPICGMDLIPVASKRTAADDNRMVHEMTPEAVAMANIHTSRVSGVSPEGEILLTGKIQADERLLASVTAKYPGRIDRLYVSFTGQAVQVGQKLATIYSPELLTAQKELLEAVKSKATFPELYTSAREKLRLWKLTEKQIDEIEKTGKIMDQFDVLADRGGIVTQLNISVGDYVNTGSVLFSLADFSKIWVMIDAYETDLPFIKTGNEISFTVAALPGKTFNARVTYIDPVINPGTRTASVRAEAVNRNMELKPEMFVNARIRSSVSSAKKSLAIPRSALLWSGKRSIVYVKVPEAEFPSFEMREITIGSRMGEMYLVEAGLEAGEEIVTNGVFAIDAAAQLSGNYSMLMRPEAKTLDVSQAFQEQITSVADAYLKLKNALVESDVNAAKGSLDAIQKALALVDMSRLKGQAHDQWMSLNSNFDTDLEELSKTNDLEVFRQHFAILSENILEMTESFGLLKEKTYKQFCPMAMGDKGANWLSEIEDIRNPYFGSTMLGCGEVKETYRKGQRVFKKNGNNAQPVVTGHNH